MLDIQNKIKFEGNCWIGSIDPSNFNSSEENRIKAVTDLASITTGKLGLDDKCGRFVETIRRYNLYKRLLTESAGKPSTPFEFIPVVENYELYEYNPEDVQDYIRFSVGDISQGRHTNLRSWLNNPYFKYQFNNSKDVKNFKIIVGQVPWKVISHLRTHRAFSWLVESSRNKRYLKDVEFWYPSWWENAFITMVNELDKGTLQYLTLDVASKRLKPEEATMELSDRRLVKFAMCAWKQDENSWNNLFKVRGKGTGTQSITGITVDTIKKSING